MTSKKGSPSVQYVVILVLDTGIQILPAIRGVAQMARARALGARGREFKSLRPDIVKSSANCYTIYTLSEESKRSS